MRVINSYSRSLLFFPGFLFCSLFLLRKEIPRKKKRKKGNEAKEKTPKKVKVVRHKNI
jgi:uncharacterized membrane protein